VINALEFFFREGHSSNRGRVTGFADFVVVFVIFEAATTVPFQILVY
jgi:hypothetical protein